MALGLRTSDPANEIVIRRGGQIHVADGPRVQTLAARETETGILLLLTLGDDDATELHVPAAARQWLADIALGRRPAPIVPPIDAIWREANGAARESSRG